MWHYQLSLTLNFSVIITGDRKKIAKEKSRRTASIVDQVPWFRGVCACMNSLGRWEESNLVSPCEESCWRSRNIWGNTAEVCYLLACVHGSCWPHKRYRLMIWPNTDFMWFYCTFPTAWFRLLIPFECLLNCSANSFQDQASSPPAHSLSTVTFDCSSRSYVWEFRIETVLYNL